MVEPIKLYRDIEELKKSMTEVFGRLEGKTPNLHSMRALVACHDLQSYLSALIALQELSEGENKE